MITHHLRFGGGLLAQDLRRQGECVRQEHLGEVLELADLLARQFFFAMCTLIAIKANQVRPLLQIGRQLSVRGEKVNALCKSLAGKGSVEFSRRDINRLAEHRRTGICVPMARVLKALNKKSLLQLTKSFLERYAHYLKKNGRCAVCQFWGAVRGRLPRQGLAGPGGHLRHRR